MTTEILRHASELHSKLPAELRGVLRTREADLEILAHGPEASLFADALSQSIGLESQITVQTHFGIWDIVTLAEADPDWQDFAPDLDDLRHRANECLEVIRKSHHVWVENSWMMRSVCTQTELDPARLEVAPLVGCPPGIQVATGRRNKTILVAGRCAYEKGFDLAIRAFDIGRRKYPSLREFSLECIVMERHPFAYAFQSRYLKMLRDLAASMASSHAITIRPGISHSQLMDDLGQCGLLMVPSRYEPFGVIVLEGLMRGTPTVVSPHVGACESVATDLLMIARENCPDALAHALFLCAAARPKRQDRQWPTVDSLLDGRFRRSVESSA